MSSFVLVHGSWHGAWCWYKIVARLRALASHSAYFSKPDELAAHLDEIAAGAYRKVLPSPR